MIEESYIRLYAQDFSRMAVRAETQGTDDAVVAKRMADARSHAALMDSRKGEGHLAALIVRLRDEARRPPSHRFADLGAEPEALVRRHDFLNGVADALGVRFSPEAVPAR